jgi:hypothetical protein
MLDLLLNECFNLWNKRHIKVIVAEIITSNWTSGAIHTVISGRCFSHLLDDMHDDT